MKRIIQTIVLLVFVSYWCVTLLYSSPESYIKIKAEPVLSKFEIFFYQKWTFFAPPADFNFRLYFEYLDKDSSQLATYEVLKPIALQKQAKAPFNTNEQYVDYIVNSSVIELNDLLVNYFKAAKEEKPTLSADENYKNAIGNFNSNAAKAQYPGFQTLKNYLNLHFKKHITDNPLLTKAVFGRMILAQQQLPRFEERDSLLIKSYVPKEMTAYYSLPLKLQ